MKKITIKEIAKQAGVSVGTVDRVLHNRGEVAEKTKKLVLEIAQKGNYSTNVFARNLKLNKTFNLAVILPKDNEYWEMQWKGIEKAAAEYQSLGINLNTYNFDRHNINSFLKESQKVLKANPDGVILAPLLEKEAIKICDSLKNNNIPYVFVDSNLSNTKPIAFIGQNSFKSGYLAAKLLSYGSDQNHKAIIVRFNDFDSLNKTIEERIEGFRRFYSENNFDEKNILELNIDVHLKDTSNRIHEVIKAHKGAVHLFIPNSRAHYVAREIEAKQYQNLRIIGYDLVDENIQYLINGKIDFIIHQNPKLQGELSIQSLYKHLILKTPVNELQYMPLEIITAENLEYADN